jgi:hypothetical protein
VATKHELDAAKKIAADRAATRAVGMVLFVPGAIGVLIALVTLFDFFTYDGAPQGTRLAARPILCGVVIGAPLVWAGLRRILSPDHFR